MSLLVTADLHLSSSARDAYRFANMELLGRLIQDHRPEALLILGDLTEEKDYHASTLVNDVADLVYYLASLTPVWVLRGNHDYVDADCPFFHFLRRMHNVNWINEPGFRQIGKIGALFLPHTADYQRDWKGMLPVDESVDWVFAHNTFEGARTEHGHRLGGVPLDVFRTDDNVISGDIHTPQSIGPVTYVGSPYRIDFGDDFDPRVIFVTGTRIQSVPMNGPQKLLIEMHSVDELDKLAANRRPDDVIKVRYYLKRRERDQWPEIKAAIREKLSPFAIQPISEAAPRQAVKSVSRQVKSDEEVVRSFGKQQRVPDETLKTGLELL
jgi:DNA repair exonuclease SbcCD nuclease subunit